MTLLDDVDKKIIELLKTDSRQSYREIAKTLNISHVNVSNRIKQLEEAGVIRGYTVVLDPDNLDYYPLCLRISAESGYDLSKIGKEISQHDDINVVLRVSGECEILALAMCGNRKKAIELLNKINNIEGISKAESHIVLDAVKLSGIKLNS
jgi:Lrp/AsnC family transcriptional regulator for asnA, asnC and gidA